MTSLIAEPQLALAFLRWVRAAGPWTLTAIALDRKTIETRTFDESSVEVLMDWLDANNGVRNVYYALNPLRSAVSKKASKEDVEEMAFLHVDCDPPKGADIEKSRAEILDRLQRFAPPPSAIIDSGGGYQGLWRLDTPLYVGGNVQRAEECEAYPRQLELVLKGDHCANCDRILRLPGTWNLPDNKKKAAGRTERLATVVGSLAEGSYGLDRFTPAPRLQSTNGPSLGAAPRVQISVNLSPVLVDDLPEGVSQRIKVLVVHGHDPAEPSKYGSRSETLFAVLCDLVRAGCDDDTMAAIILNSEYRISDSVLEKRNARDYAARQIQRARAKVKSPEIGVQLSDFWAYMPGHSYIFAPTGDHWPASSVNSRLGPVKLLDANGSPLLDDQGKPKTVSAASWLDKNQHVEQMTWCPGCDQAVKDKLVSDGAWIDRLGCTVFNQYRPPTALDGDASQSGPWLDLVRRVYPEDTDHIILWMAQRLQQPHVKVNHALVLGGNQGVGKDTLLEPLKAAVGPWNFSEVSPKQVFGRFNGFLKCVILRVSEARDLGDVDRYAFYDHMKAYTAAPPDVLRVDEKFVREYPIFNVCGVIITSNHKTDGIYLHADDRRHYVAWSPLSRHEFSNEYWIELWRWYNTGGIGHVVAYLRAVDLSAFDPKAPPPQTPAFWDIVSANGAPEDAEMADVLAKIGCPDAITIPQLIQVAATTDGLYDFAVWMGDRRNSRKIPHRLQEAGYCQVRNRTAKDGMFTVGGRHCRIYAKHELSPSAAITAAERLVASANMAGDDSPF